MGRLVLGSIEEPVSFVGRFGSVCSGIILSRSSGWGRILQTTSSTSVRTVMMTSLGQKMLKRAVVESTVQSLGQRMPKHIKEGLSLMNTEQPSQPADVDPGKSRLPRRIVIGPHVFWIERPAGPFVGSNGNYSTLQGEIDHMAGVIRVAEAYPERMFCTLWHEVLHAIDDLAGTELDEETVNRLAPLISMVLLQNPGLRGGGLQTDPDAV